jgi:hypothetical protein
MPVARPKSRKELNLYEALSATIRPNYCFYKEVLKFLVTADSLRKFPSLLPQHSESSASFVDF